MNSFAGDFAALDKFEPAIEDAGSVIEQRELVPQGTEYVGCGRGGPAKAVSGFRTSRDAQNSTRT